MPFQQLGFTPYPRSPRRDTSAYQNFGKGFAEIGAGADKMLSSFQDMKERRKRSLMAQQQHDQDIAAKETLQEKRKYDLEQQKLADDRAQKVREFHQKQFEIIQKQKELAGKAQEAQQDRDTKVQLEQMKTQAQTPSPAVALQPTTPTQPIQPGQTQPRPGPQGMTLDEHVSKLIALGANPKDYQQILKMLYPEEFQKVSKEGKWEPKTWEEWKDKYLFEQKHKRFRPGSGQIPKPEETPEGIKTILEEDIKNQTSIEQQIIANTPDRWQKDVRDFLNRVTGEKALQRIPMNQHLAGLLKEYRNNRRTVAKSMARYRQLHGKAYEPSKEFLQGLGQLNPQPGATGTATTQPDVGGQSSTLDEQVQEVINTASPEDRANFEALAREQNTTVEAIVSTLIQRGYFSRGNN